MSFNGTAWGRVKVLHRWDRFAGAGGAEWKDLCVQDPELVLG